jgi:hypothetical protein
MTIYLVQRRHYARCFNLGTLAVLPILLISGIAVKLHVLAQSSHPAG